MRKNTLMQPTLETLKLHLRVDDGELDDELTRLSAAALAECLAFTGLPEDSPELARQDVQNGMVLLVQADFDGTADSRQAALKAAHGLWSPYCRHFGV